MDNIPEQMSLTELTATFLQRMESFEAKLANKQNPTPCVEELAAEFVAFKTFVLSSLRAIQHQMVCLSTIVDQLEMQSRRKFLLIHGVAEDAQENTPGVVVKVLSERLKQTSFVVSDISRSHRMGRTLVADKPRPILCKFRDVSVRDKIWSAKAGLKGSGVTLSEFLTKARHDVFMKARLRYGVSKCWTRQGFVFVLGSDGVRHRVSCLRDLDGIQLKEVTTPAPVEKETAPSKALRRKAASKK